MPLSHEQIAMRATGIGASEAPMVLGESPHGGPAALWLRKLGLATFEPSPAQEMGNLLESGMAEYYARKTGATLEEATTCRHPKYPHILATPDRWVNGRQKLVQIKVVGRWMADHWRDDEDGIPDYVRIQVTQEMAVTGTRVCDVAALLCGTDPRIYQVEYDDELAEAIIEADSRFWFDHVVARVPPTPTGTDVDDEVLRALYPLSSAGRIDATPEMESLMAKLRKARGERAWWEREESRLAQEFKTLMGEAGSVRGADWTVTWRTNAKGARPFIVKTDDEKTTHGKAA